MECDFKNGLVHDPVISEQLFNWVLNSVKLSLEASQLCLPSLTLHEMQSASSGVCFI